MEILDYDGINWQKYKDKKGGSGIINYSAGETLIWVEYRTGQIYLYTDEVTGKDAIYEMKQKATEGVSLGTFINQSSFRKKYAAAYELKKGRYIKIK
jgi:hypothetical protein